MPVVKPGQQRSRRAERTAATRRQILDAARKLFGRDGYAASTLTAIADEAAVAVQTVYAVYGSKAGILRALRDSVLNQSEADHLFEQALSETAASRKVELFARSIRERWEYGHDIVVINREAATADRVVRSEVDVILAVRRRGLRAFAQSIEPRLTPDVDVPRAAALLDALTLPEVYRELTDVHRWSADDYERWLSATVAHQLLESAERSG